MGYVVPILFVVSLVWAAEGYRADHKPPKQLTELATLLHAAGGVTDVEQVDQNKWELTVDFPAIIQDNALKLLHDIRGVTVIRILKGGVTDKGLAHLKSLPDLRLLVINSKEITDEGMVVIGALKSLIKLDVIQPRLTGKGLAELAPLVGLKELYLYGSDIRDEDVEPLKKMTHLEWLRLPPAVTKAKCELLQTALPGTQVIRHDK